MKLNKLLVCLVFSSFGMVSAQEYFPKHDGVKVKNNNFYAFTNATIHTSPSQTLQNATLLVHDGRVVSVGTSVQIPANSVVKDLSGKHIYPSFIDAYSNFGAKKPKRASSNGRSAQYEPSREGFYWNDHIMSDQNTIEGFSFSKKDAEKLLQSGFGVVNSFVSDGIVRGTGTLVSLNLDASNSVRVLSNKSAQYFSLSKSITSNQSYPTSLMGSLALLRQFYADSKWYAQGKSQTKDRSIEAFLSNKSLPQIFEAGSLDNLLRVDKLGDQNAVQYTILSGGDSYKNPQKVKASGATLIVPLDFPKAYDVSNPAEAEILSLEQLLEWNQAPSNPKVLEENGIPFAFTAHKLKNPKDLLSNMRLAVAYGLSKNKALEALTTAPARILKQSNIGQLKAGYLANFLITSGDLFEADTKLFQNWTQGTAYVIEDENDVDIRGNYSLAIHSTNLKLEISGSKDKPSVKVFKDSIKLNSKFNYADSWMELSVDNEDKSAKYLLSARIDKAGSFSGMGIATDGSDFKFTATKDANADQKSDKGQQYNTHELMPVSYPNKAFGNIQLPKQQTILFKNATVWTSEAAGILEHTDVLVKDGKIAKIGTNLSARNAQVIDATGKHLTAGIIDEHSHLALSAVNEAGHNSTAEVKMEDAIDSNHPGIYRSLAGGVTSLQLLHGSANPIGGRSAIIKTKWGATADELVYENSPQFIKFALGENVKQSNWSSYSRFPQSRMGVEQLFVNYFQRAKEYDKAKKAGKDVRYDEELEVLAQIINGERFISCHSYVQSEINMLMKVAEQFGFRVNTFTHILEGYKVADKMAEHGVGGSTFSDWWAYKFEVNDAIPYNAAIMQREGVTVAINSDDAEMNRRLNQEAAKTVKYGGMSEEEAWKMVTINPAKLLHLDHRVGSIKEGKDADLVLWNDHPMSVYAKAEKTLIEGAVYFDLEEDLAKRKTLQKQKGELMQMMLQEKLLGKPTQKPKTQETKYLSCETL
ncbi:MAG: amidohydrolase family protein [Flavobacteriaceae bacterium]|nr:amidohydrolase family protein [Flavobacteriaceae bacterium]